MADEIEILELKWRFERATPLVTIVLGWYRTDVKSVHAKEDMTGLRIHLFVRPHDGCVDVVFLIVDLACSRAFQRRGGDQQLSVDSQAQFRGEKRKERRTRRHGCVGEMV